MTSLPLGNMPLQVFLAEYWQKKPLLVRGGLKNIASPLDADSLAGLACEEAVESRLIIQNGAQWQLQHGPFNEETFTALPASHWTLLVQAVDHWVPAAAQLLEQFNFIPRWRIDDLMMSYASDGGGVGPHYDNYDVFLVQAGGQRKWEVGGHYDESSPLQKDLPLKILDEFKPVETYLLNPGDILYVPPGVGHNGIAQGDDCITCSVGFRAPSHAEILREFTDYLGDQLTESARYSDPDLVAQKNTGEISALAFDKVQQILAHYANDKEALGDWFGRYVTAPKYATAEDGVNAGREGAIDLEELQEYFASGGSLVRNEGSRFAYIDNFDKGKQHALFVDGERLQVAASTRDLVELVCREINVVSDSFESNDANLELLVSLLRRGALYLAD